MSRVTKIYPGINYWLLNIFVAFWRKRRRSLDIYICMVSVLFQMSTGSIGLFDYRAHVRSSLFLNRSLLYLFKYQIFKSMHKMMAGWHAGCTSFLNYLRLLGRLEVGQCPKNHSHHGLSPVLSWVMMQLLPISYMTFFLLAHLASCDQQLVL